MTTQNDKQEPNPSVPQDEAIEADVAGRARTSNPDTSVPQDRPDTNTSVPQDNN